METTWLLPAVNVAWIHEGFVIRIMGADANHAFDRIDKDHAITWFARMRRGSDGFYSPINVMVAENDIELYLGQQINLVVTCTSRQRDATLAAMAADLVHIHAHDADLAQSVLDIVELLFTNDCLDLLGDCSPYLTSA